MTEQRISLKSMQIACFFHYVSPERVSARRDGVHVSAHWYGKTTVIRENENEKERSTQGIADSAF